MNITKTSSREKRIPCWRQKMKTEQQLQPNQTDTSKSGPNNLTRSLFHAGNGLIGGGLRNRHGGRGERRRIGGGQGRRNRGKGRRLRLTGNIFAISELIRIAKVLVPVIIAPAHHRDQKEERGGGDRIFHLPGMHLKGFSFSFLHFPEEREFLLQRDGLDGFFLQLEDEPAFEDITELGRTLPLLRFCGRAELGTRPVRMGRRGPKADEAVITGNLLETVPEHIAQGLRMLGQSDSLAMDVALIPMDLQGEGTDYLPVTGFNDLELGEAAFELAHGEAFLPPDGAKDGQVVDRGPADRMNRQTHVCLDTAGAVSRPIKSGF